MLIEILKHTPPWVFVLFFVLLALGWYQSKGRTIGRGKVVMVPCAMIALSLYGVISAFGVAPVGIIAWLVGTTGAAALGVALAVPRGVVYDEETLSFSIPGSWLPLLLMMAIYFTKYAVGVVLGRGLPFAASAEFTAVVSLAYGSFSGLFLARVLVIWRSIDTESTSSGFPPARE